MLELFQYMTSTFGTFCMSVVLIPTILVSIGWALNAVFVGIRGVAV